MDSPQQDRLRNLRVPSEGRALCIHVGHMPMRPVLLHKGDSHMCPAGWWHLLYLFVLGMMGWAPCVIQLSFPLCVRFCIHGFCHNDSQAQAATTGDPHERSIVMTDSTTGQMRARQDAPM